MGDIILDALIDTAKLVPFLFLTYLIMEFLEHYSKSRTRNWLQRSGKIGPIVGGVLGIVPQCGFAAAASGLYAGRIISVGTLLAVYLSSSDEMLPILISNGAPLPLMLKILGLKLLIGIVAGFAVDFVFHLLKKEKGFCGTTEISDICMREKCNCNSHFALSALKHTLRVTLFIFIFNLALNGVVAWVGEDAITTFLSGRSLLANLAASVVGLIPNCASSVVLTELYLDGILSMGAMISGLLVNAGVGLAVLFRLNRPVRDSLRIVAILWAIGFTSGVLLDLLPI